MRAAVVNVIAVFMRMFMMDASAAVLVFVVMIMLMFVSFPGKAGPALGLADLVVVQKRIVHVVTLLFLPQEKAKIIRAQRALHIIAQTDPKFTISIRLICFIVALSNRKNNSLIYSK